MEGLQGFGWGILLASVFWSGLLVFMIQKSFRDGHAAGSSRTSTGSGSQPGPWFTKYNQNGEEFHRRDVTMLHRPGENPRLCELCPEMESSPSSAPTPGPAMKPSESSMAGGVVLTGKVGEIPMPGMEDTTGFSKSPTSGIETSS
jgi:hypothetical protein